MCLGSIVRAQGAIHCARGAILCAWGATLCAREQFCEKFMLGKWVGRLDTNLAIFIVKAKKKIVIVFAPNFFPKYLLCSSGGERS